MIYIVVALKSEAQAFVDFYKLKREKLGSYSSYYNEKLRLIITGVGVQNARLGTQTLINHFDITDADTYFNIGICGAKKEYPIASLLQIGSINYKEQEYIFEPTLKQITCLDEPASTQQYQIVDMESFGFYDAVIHNPAIKKFAIYKLVSDHFEPQNVTKEKTKMLIFNTLKEGKIL